MARNDKIQWTPQQRVAIETVGQSVLVSAAAGSGKTAVLAERCAYLVCDAVEKCDVDELLVVTFTKAAAAEMRGRIEENLRKRQQASDDQRLNKQILLLNRANISTLHSFCQAVLRQHFHLIGLDPNFRVLDDEEVALLKHEIAQEIFDERFENDAQFQNFVDLYGNSDGENLLRQITSLHDLLGSIVDAEGWLADARERVVEASLAKPLIRSRLGTALAKNVRDWLSDIESRWVQLAKQISTIRGLEQYGEYVNDLLAAVGCWREAFGDGNFDALAIEIENFSPAKLPTMRNPPPQKEQMQASIESMRREMREGTVPQFARFTEDQWRDGLTQTASATEVLIDLVRDFGKSFSAAKRRLRGLDFADLERFTLQVLRQKNEGNDLTPSAAARSYRAQFKHVLVDEYQDINEVQDAILKLVSRASDESDGGNLFCVGDVKQSIYRFRLAEPARFLQRYENFKAKNEGGRMKDEASGASFHPSSFILHPSRGQVIDLSSNFRSREPLLNAINGVFERLMTASAVGIEYDASHRLASGAKFPPIGDNKCFSGAPIELHLLPAIKRDDESSENDQELDRTQREAAFIAQRINQLMSEKICVTDKLADGSPALRPLMYRDIVILLRSMKFKSEQFSEVLRLTGIPVHSDSGSGFFESMEIRDMRSLLRLLDNQQQDVPMAAVLRSPIAGFNQAEDCLAKIRLAHAVDPFHQAVVKYAAEHNDQLATQLRAFLHKLKIWREMAHQRPLAELVWHIYDTTGYLAFCAGLRDGQQRAANLLDFHERAKQFGTFQRQGLGRFMEFLDNLAERTGDVGQPSIASEADDVVRIMSVHRAKGLEFPVVFLADLGKKHNLLDTHGAILVDRQAGIGMMVANEQRQIRYPSLAHVLVKDRIKKESLAEELRVLYVAMTRAKEHLILVGTCGEDAAEVWQEQWLDHVGPLPAQRVLTANTFLDWIGPAAVAMSAAKDRFETTSHNEQEATQWATAAQRGVRLSDTQLRLAKLEPLSPAPQRHPQAERLKQRLTAEYQFKEFIKAPASQSVGALTKSERSSSEGSSSLRSDLKAPHCVMEQIVPAPEEIGSATHLVLQHLDFSRPCDREDVQSQIAEILRKKLLTAAISDTVQVDSIVWLISTPLGHLLRKNHHALRREAPIYFAQAAQGATSDDPLDRMMVRGRVDVLIPDKDGIVIADYKTDRIPSAAVPARAKFYEPQLASYRDAIATITGKTVKSASLVFLSAKVIREL